MLHGEFLWKICGRLVRFVLFWYTDWKNILLLFTITELRRLRLWYIKHLVSVQAPFHLKLTMQGKVHDVKFQGGCSGNTQGVARLVEGMDAKEAISRMEGIRCGFKPTSCPDQLAKALKEALN